jgi:hypothetical protein
MRWWWLFALVACGLLGLVACAADCPEGLHPFKNGCADRLTINFMTCTEGRGRSLEENRQARLEGVVDTAFRVTGGEGVVDVAREVVETENTPVARDIVRYCLELTNKTLDVLPPQSRENVRFVDELENRSRGVADTPAAPAETPSDPSPTVTLPPTATPTQAPTLTPTLEPTATPTPVPTATFTPVPTDTPTPAPTPTLDLPSTAAPTSTVASVASDVPGTPLALGEEASGIIDANTKPWDVYAIELVAGQEVVFTLSGPSKDIYVELANPDTESFIRGSHTWAFYESYADAGWRKTFVPAVSGTYYLGLSAYQSSQSYTVSVS